MSELFLKNKVFHVYISLLNGSVHKNVKKM